MNGEAWPIPFLHGGEARDGGAEAGTETHKLIVRKVNIT